ncbi:MAG: hypothetical protein AABW51_04630 [Nanoarchaeota archaeon]
MKLKISSDLRDSDGADNSNLKSFDFDNNKSITKSGLESCSLIKFLNPNL